MVSFHKSAVAILLSFILMLSFSGCAETQSNEIEPQSSSQVEQSSQNTEISSELTVSKMEDSNKSSSEPSSSIDQSEFQSSSSTSSFLDQHDFCIDELAQEYLGPVFCAGITYNSWDNAEQIPADKFSIFYLIKCL